MKRKIYSDPEEEGKNCKQLQMNLIYLLMMKRLVLLGLVMGNL